MDAKTAHDILQQAVVAILDDGAIRLGDGLALKLAQVRDWLGKQA